MELNTPKNVPCEAKGQAASIGIVVSVTPGVEDEGHEFEAVFNFTPIKIDS